MQDEPTNGKAHPRQNFSKMSQQELEDLVEKEFNSQWNEYANNNEVSKIDNFSVSAVKGSVEINIKTEEFDYRYKNEFRCIHEKLPSNINYVIDFKMVKYIDSSALGMMLILLQHNGEESRIELINCCDTVKGIFKVTKLDSMFDVS
jgi:HptB-dependent secretion and biofilm anti anti-sigma factor